MTLTTQYNPRNPDELTVEAIRERVVGLTRAIDHLWKRGLKRVGTALLLGVEMGSSGAVHAHMLYWGPFIPHAWFVGTAREAYDRAGFAFVSRVDGDAAELARALRETVKYTAKAPSPRCERWYSEAREVMQPALAARWELATHGLHLRARRGAFRARSGDEPPEEHAPPGEPTPCANCGSCGGYDTVEVDTRQWVSDCHARGVRAFDGSRVEPRPREPTTRCSAPVTTAFEEWVL